MDLHGFSNIYKTVSTGPGGADGFPGLENAPQSNSLEVQMCLDTAPLFMVLLCAMSWHLGFIMIYDKYTSMI